MTANDVVLAGLSQGQLRFVNVMCLCLVLLVSSCAEESAEDKVANATDIQQQASDLVETNTDKPNDDWSITPLIHFGDVPVGTTTMRRLRLENPSSMELHIDSVTIKSPFFEVAATIEAPDHAKPLAIPGDVPGGSGFYIDVTLLAGAPPGPLPASKSRDGAGAR